MNEWPQQQQNVQSLVEDLLNQFPDEFRSLDAGCGSSSCITFPGYVVTDGIDISSQQLERNTHLDQKIQDDLQTYVHPEEHYHLIVCWDVIEHLPDPEAAVRQLFRAVKKGGLLILAMPNYYSFEAKLTKYTPLWFHVMVYRHIIGNPNAGHDDVGPFKTFLRPQICVDYLGDLGEAEGFDVAYKAVYERKRLEMLKKKSLPLYWAYMTAATTAKAATLGSIDPSKASAIIALRKRI